MFEAFEARDGRQTGEEVVRPAEVDDHRRAVALDEPVEVRVDLRGAAPAECSVESR